jgi:hypothetical protein
MTNPPCHRRFTTPEDVIAFQQSTTGCEIIVSLEPEPRMDDAQRCLYQAMRECIWPTHDHVFMRPMGAHHIIHGSSAGTPSFHQIDGMVLILSDSALFHGVRHAHDAAMPMHGSGMQFPTFPMYHVCHDDRETTFRAGASHREITAMFQPYDQAMIGRHMTDGFPIRSHPLQRMSTMFQPGPQGVSIPTDRQGVSEAVRYVIAIR